MFLKLIKSGKTKFGWDYS